MDRVIKNSACDITLTNEEDITGQLAAQIRFKKPGETGESSGEWDYTSITEVSGTLFYKIPHDILDTPGRWKAWIIWTDADSREYECRAFEFEVIDIGSR